MAGGVGARVTDGLTVADPFDLDRFVTAQEPVIGQVRAELRAGRKVSHWMWFVFPQMAGLGSSAMARRYAISGQDEAGAYLLHPLLGERLRACTELVQARTALEVFGEPDTTKFRSCMTLFAAVSQAGSPFERALGRYFGGEADAATVRLRSGG